MGIGKIMAVEMARKYRCRVVAVDRRQDLFEELAKEIQNNEGSCDCLNYDLSDPKEVDKLTDYLKKAYPKIDLLLYNAGVFFPNEAWDVSDYELTTLMNVNFFSPVRMIKGLLLNVENSECKHIAVVASLASIIQGGTLFALHSSQCIILHGIKTRHFRIFNQSQIRPAKASATGQCVHRMPLRHQHYFVPGVQE